MGITIESQRLERSMKRKIVGEDLIEELHIRRWLWLVKKMGIPRKDSGKYREVGPRMPI